VNNRTRREREREREEEERPLRAEEEYNLSKRVRSLLCCGSFVDSGKTQQWEKKKEGRTLPPKKSKYK
jgi:hypothetical protein